MHVLLSVVIQYRTSEFKPVVAVITESFNSYVSQTGITLHTLLHQQEINCTKQILTSHIRNKCHYFQH